MAIVLGFLRSSRSSSSSLVGSGISVSSVVTMTEEEEGSSFKRFPSGSDIVKEKGKEKKEKERKIFIFHFHFSFFFSFSLLFFQQLKYLRGSCWFNSIAEKIQFLFFSSKK